MNYKMLAIAVITSASLTGLFIFYVKKCFSRIGARMTFNFFFFAFLYIFSRLWRQISYHLISLVPAERAAYYMEETEFLAKDPQTTIITFFLSIISLLGWICLFYTGWLIAGIILAKSAALRKRLFATSFLSSLICGFLVFLIFSAAKISGLSGIEYLSLPNDIFLAGKAPFTNGFYFCLYFITAYFLIEMSHWKTKSWRMVFFLLPFLHVWVTRLFGTGQAVILERVAVFSAIILLSFFNRDKLNLDKTP